MKILFSAMACSMAALQVVGSATDAASESATHAGHKSEKFWGITNRDAAVEAFAAGADSPLAVRVPESISSPSTTARSRLPTVISNLSTWGYAVFHSLPPDGNP